MYLHLIDQLINQVSPGVKKTLIATNSNQWAANFEVLLAAPGGAARSRKRFLDILNFQKKSEISKIDSSSAETQLNQQAAKHHN